MNFLNARTDDEDDDSDIELAFKKAHEKSQCCESVVPIKKNYKPNAVSYLFGDDNDNTKQNIISIVETDLCGIKTPFYSTKKEGDGDSSNSSSSDESSYGSVQYGKSKKRGHQRDVNGSDRKMKQLNHKIHKGKQRQMSSATKKSKLSSVRSAIDLMDDSPSEDEDEQEVKNEENNVNGCSINHHHHPISNLGKNKTRNSKNSNKNMIFIDHELLNNSSDEGEDDDDDSLKLQVQQKCNKLRSSGNRANHINNNKNIFMNRKAHEQSIKVRNMKIQILEDTYRTIYNNSISNKPLDDIDESFMSQKMITFHICAQFENSLTDLSSRSELSRPPKNHTGKNVSNTTIELSVSEETTVQDLISSFLKFHQLKRNSVTIGMVYNNKPLSPNKTLSFYGIGLGVARSIQIHAKVYTTDIQSMTGNKNQGNVGGNVQIDVGPKIQLTLQNPTGGKVSLSIGVKQTFQILMDQYLLKLVETATTKNTMETNNQTVHFKFDGEIIPLMKTPKDYDMETDDQIDVVMKAKTFVL